MGRHSYTILSIALGFSLGANAYADSRVKSKYMSGGQTTETTIYTKASRQRFEPGAGMAIINQYDLKRTLQVFDQKKSYMLMSPETLSRAAVPAGQAQPAAAPASSASSGGVVRVAVTVTETGEQKQLFGYAARRVKSVMTKEAGTEACDPGNETVETDGWYIDYEPETAAGAANPSPAQPPSPSACHDDVQYKQSGNGKLGYPLAYSLKTTKDGKTTTMEMEVEDFSTANLDAALFEAPAGYTELQSFNQLSALLSGSPSLPAAAAGASSPVLPKTPGTPRVGVADPGNRSGKSLGPVSPRDQLIAQLVSSKIDAIPLAGQSPSEVEAAARQQEVDYVLYVDVAEVKKDSGGLGKFGGVLSKASSITGGGPAKEKIEAKVDYKLLPIGNSKALLSSSATGSNGGGFNVNSAIHLATTFSGFGMIMKLGMLDPNMMRLLSQSGGMGLGGPGLGIPGMSRGGFDPGLGPFLSIMQTTQSMMKPQEPTEEGKAVSDALGDAAKSVSEAIKKKK